MPDQDLYLHDPNTYLYLILPLLYCSPKNLIGEIWNFLSSFLYSSSDFEARGQFRLGEAPRTLSRPVLESVDKTIKLFCDPVIRVCDQNDSFYM